MDLVTIAKEQLRVYRSPNWETPLKEVASSGINGDAVEWSKDGYLLAALNGDGCVSVYDSMSEYSEIFVARKQFNSIRRFYFSPCNSYLVTYERYVSKDAKENVFCHCLKTGEITISVTLRTLTDHNWPIFTWSSDERVCLYMTTNTVKVMHGRNLTLANPLYSLTIPNIVQFALSPNGQLLAGFFPESKGQPASLRIFDLCDRSAQPKASKSTFNAQTCKILWNEKSSGLVCIFSTDSDATSSSYYGTSSLFFMRVNEKGESTHTVLVTGESGGPCHDVCWSPNADEFVAILGKMPAEIALYDGKTGSKRVSFGITRRNTLRWNEFGRLFLAGGFGNLPGDIDVWDKNKTLCLSTVRIPCTVLCEFAPDGRHFFSASVFPRMRVDNFVQIVNYDGTIVAKLTNFCELYGCKWRPSGDLFEDTPSSPRVVQTARNPANSHSDEEVPKMVKAAYKPPGGSGALAEQMRKEREIENERKAVKVKSVKAPIVEVGGPSASALRNARKKKTKEMTAKLVASGNLADSTKNSTRKKIYLEDEPEEEEEAPVVIPPTENSTDPSKRIRNLQKKLKEIAALKESGKVLSGPQIAKIESEAAALAEIAQLEALL